MGRVGSGRVMGWGCDWVMEVDAPADVAKSGTHINAVWRLTGLIWPLTMPPWTVNGLKRGLGILGSN